jgi:hypothetical protein
LLKETIKVKLIKTIHQTLERDSKSWSDSSIEITKLPNKLQIFMTNKPKTPNEQIKTHFIMNLSWHPSSKQREEKKKKKKNQIPKRAKTPHWLYT